MKRVVIAVMLLVLGCSRYQAVEYKPSFANVSDPASTIQKFIESQPQAYAYLVPSKVEVNEYVIKIYEGHFGSLQLFTSIPFKNIDNVNPYKTPDSSIWWVDIHDKQGIWMFGIASYSESDVKRFLDALYFMMEQNKD